MNWHLQPKERIIEYMLESENEERLVDMNLVLLQTRRLASPAPGGGSISAYCGAMGAALGTMVANLSAHKRGWEIVGKECLNGQKKD